MNVKSLSFQDVIMRLQAYWAERGCLIWLPYSEKVGAGTGNPGTVLRVLGPEPWNVAYVEPSYRPDDGRYAENPNRMQMHTQFQVILKPAPSNPQELYLGSLAAIGIDRDRHDVRFVEDNWESPALGAWGLGWEVWLDGLEITQFTYFQQAGGFSLEPVAAEMTYGLERIVMYLQGMSEVWQIDWDGRRTYGDLLRTPEVEHCVYDFEVADVGRLKQMFQLFEDEAKGALAHKLVIPAHDYVLRCSHTFNLLDARGAIGVTERAHFFARMRDLARQVSVAYVEQRQREEYPWLSMCRPEAAPAAGAALASDGPGGLWPSAPASFLLEIGAEELPAADVVGAIEQLEAAVPALLASLRLAHGRIRVLGTPRRLAVHVSEVAPLQAAEAVDIKGPPEERAFDAAGGLTQAGLGFARSRGVSPADLVVREETGKRYVFAMVRRAGRPAAAVLAEALPGLLAGLKFTKTMRWNSTGVAFTRPVRWLVSLLGDAVVPFGFAGLSSGDGTRGPRAEGSPELQVPGADGYDALLEEHHIIADRSARRRAIAAQVGRLADEVGGTVPVDPGLLEEVTDLVEWPTALRGDFAPEYLALPAEVLITVMRKHQRYFPLRRGDGSGQLMPHFITVRNGGPEHLDEVRAGNEGVLRARFSDAAFFFRADTSRRLGDFAPRLATLTFQAQLGSMLDKVARVERLAPVLGAMLGLNEDELAAAGRAATLSKCDLATQMVVELTSLQGVMGREYALLSGERPEVAQAIFEHYLPRFQGDALPRSPAGVAVGLAHRLDSLVGLFAVGMAPTGSTDPFGLRRDALGIVQVLAAAEQPLDLRPALAAAAGLLPVAAGADVQAAVLTFIRDRLYGYLRDDGLAHDVAAAVLAERSFDPFGALKAARQLSALVAAPDWTGALTAYARCKRIVRNLEEVYPLVPELYAEAPARDLFLAWQAAAAGLDGTAATLGSVLNDLQAPVNRFFTEVLVMAEDPQVRQARLALVQRIAALPAGIADLSLLQGF